MTVSNATATICPLVTITNCTVIGNKARQDKSEINLPRLAGQQVGGPIYHFGTTSTISATTCANANLHNGLVYTLSPILWLY